MFYRNLNRSMQKIEAMVSVRVWQGGEENADFRVDRAWQVGTTIDLVTPYGRANSTLPAGALHVEVYVDAVRAASLDVTVAP